MDIGTGDGPPKKEPTKPLPLTLRPQAQNALLSALRPTDTLFQQIQQNVNGKRPEDVGTLSIQLQENAQKDLNGNLLIYIGEATSQLVHEISRTPEQDALNLKELRPLLVTVSENLGIPLDDEKKIMLGITDDYSSDELKRLGWNHNLKHLVPHIHYFLREKQKEEQASG